MRRPLVRPLVLVAGALVLLGLAGCAGPVLGVLEQEQTEQDQLTIRTDLDGVDLESTRFLAERDGVEYFVARPVAGTGTEDTVCLLVEEGIGVGLECAPLTRGEVGATIRDSRVTAVLLPDDIDRNDLADEGFELLHPNLAVRPAGAD
ncbi:hypothetical protein FJV46_01850 [Arthrobacter agilis]|uniref:hypothetical protein n=1 Tax=Arthrobacter agilis TaxID=37921 RepID=UPI000B350746|nr:hypothetical protein [Arthrobacter agilis]OUM40620.1 hypothetical protein B8W74_14085 [Arthrobacter agilis]PPB45232.1 hypothetical protein CI784_14115 [Arthrobacter agilis]TPV27935.1 hypothetical protein FJV46_01850 [Arthrobacter agilis]VDR31383.1 Uncharacterised protein [Arthrobacter agilis]